MTKDEALDLALEFVSDIQRGKYKGDAEEVITAIKQARALDKMAENARELGLDYEPADGTQVSKVWWDGEKLMAKPIPLEDIYQPVQEPVGLIDRLKNPEQHYEFTDPKKANAVLMSLCQEAADALAAQREHEPENEPFVSLASVQEPEIVQRVKRYAGQTMRTARNPNITARECIELANWIVANTTPPPAQPAVPDAIGPNEDELPAYAAGWNDCRAEMLKGMKP
jgi:hypothetical protein